MNLPFTHDQFLDVFATYNRLLWPVAVLLWLLSLGAVLHLLRAGPRASPLVAAVLVAHWAWSAVAYDLPLAGGLALHHVLGPSGTVAPDHQDRGR